MGKSRPMMEPRTQRGSMHVNDNAKCSKRRIRWTSDLHQRFEHAVAELGGANYATPKGILERMKAPDVTIMHVKSHLQKYRLTLTSDTLTTRKYSGSDDGPSCGQGRIMPNRGVRGSGLLADMQGSEDDLGVEDAAVRMDQDEKGTENFQQQPAADDAARKKLVDTVVQQHTMQEELRHQIRVQTELYRNLQNQHNLLQQHFLSQAFQQQQHARQLSMGHPIHLDFYPR